MENQETTIDLRELFTMLKKRLWMIVLVTILATVASGVISYYVMTPIYEASTQILVNKSEQHDAFNPSVNDIQSNLQLIDTYNVILKSQRILEVVIQDMNLDLTADQLSGKIKVDAVQNSQVMALSVEDPDPERAVKIANGVAATFQQEIKTIMSADNVHILAQAKLGATPTPVQPKPMLNMAIAFVVGLMGAVGIVFLLEYLDNTIKDEQDVEQILGLTVLASIAKMDKKAQRKKKKKQASVSTGGDSFEA